MVMFVCAVAALEAQSGRPQADDGTIRTYAGLSATTQERIRRYNLSLFSHNCCLFFLLTLSDITKLFRNKIKS